MAYKFFSIPLAHPESAEAELNRFLSSTKVSGIEKHFVNDGVNSGWAVAVQFGGPTVASSSGGVTADPNRNRIDYQQTLTPDEFTIYVRLRDLRKELATAEGIKLHAIFTNEQLSLIAKAEPKTQEDLAKIPGIGEKRLKQYGAAFFAKRWENDEAGTKPF
jgi:superfamily II DNA helicase RecQ